MTFEDALKNLGLKPANISFNVTEDVYCELESIARNNGCSMEDLMRSIVDEYLMEE